MTSVSEWVWSEKFWLPSNYTWADLNSTPDVPKPQFSDTYIVPFLAVILLLVRIAFEKFIALPFCKYAGIKDSVKQPVEPNLMCEKVFSATPNPKTDRIQGLAKQLDWSVMKVEQWFRKRRNLAKHSILKKATETCWRCLLYFALFLYGCVTLFPTNWLYDPNEWFRGYIREQPFTVALKWYYLIEFAFYTSLLFSQFLDHKRSDFWQMFLHHIVTLFLIYYSFTTALFRIGVVIMLIHDAADYWLEAAKIINYMKLQKICDVTFVIFAVNFYATRWIYYPFVVINAYLFKSPQVIGRDGAYYMFCILLSTLQLLHLYWGYLVGRMIYQFTVAGKVDKDTRSEDESTEDEADQKASSNGLKKKNK